MNYSIVIPTCNRINDISLTIESIIKQTTLPLEIIIIDQSDDDQTRELIAHIKNSSNAINFIYIHQPIKSLVAARNKGISIAKGEIITFLDDDVVLFDNYFENICRYFSNDGMVGGLSGNVITKLQGLKWSFRKVLLGLFLLNYYNGKTTISGFGYPIFGRKITRPLEVEMLSGCNMNFRQEFLKENKFDEWFTGYSFREDVELSYRISQKTILKMIPEAKLYHNYSQSNRINIQMQKVMEVKNYFYFYKKHVRKTCLQDFLFSYSLFGLLFICFIEYLFNFTKEKRNQLKGFIFGIIELIKKK